MFADAGLSAGVWRGVLARAAEFGRRAVAVDLAGVGFSRTSRRRPSVANAVRDVSELLDAMRLVRVDVAGQGLGDRVARALAARLPDRVRRGATLAQPDEVLHARVIEAKRSPDALRMRILDELSPAISDDQRSEIELLLARVGDGRLRRACLELASAAASPLQPWRSIDSDVFADPARLFAALDGD